MLSGTFSKSLLMSVALHGAAILVALPLGYQAWQAGTTHLHSTGGGSSTPGGSSGGSSGSPYIHASDGPPAGEYSLPPTGGPRMVINHDSTSRVEIVEEHDVQSPPSVLDAQADVPPVQMVQTPGEDSFVIGLGSDQPMPAGSRATRPPSVGGGSGAAGGGLASGDGIGQGNGTGPGDGQGVGSGSGAGSGRGNGIGDGSGMGTGNGSGDRFGAGDGSGGLCVGFGRPVYPTESRRRGEEGTVVLEVEIRPDGAHGRIDIVSSSGFRRLDRAAVDAFERAQFVPATRNHQPVASSKRFVIHFRLDELTKS